MLDLLQMLCALPTPCGDESVAQKYIGQKFSDVTIDSFSNSVRRLSGQGEKLLVYAALDEDAAVAMDIQDEKVYFSHIGQKKIYPSMTVSFGGYTGVICGEETQYLQMTDKNHCIEAGRIGVFDGEFEGETEQSENILLGKNIAARTAIAAMLTASRSIYDTYLVCGVQTNHREKGLYAALETIKPNRVLILEETDAESFAVKILAERFSASPQSTAALEACLTSCGLPYTRTVNEKEKTVATAAPWGKTAVLGIPVLFKPFMRQGIQVQTVLNTQKLINAYLEGNYEQ